MVAASLAVGLAACTATTPSTPSTGAPAPAESGTSAPTAPVDPEAPVAFVPDGDATANLPIFTQTVEQVWAGDSRQSGRAYIDALVAAGFADKTMMQLTPDQTTLGQAAESIQFSVRVTDQCLVGQVGSATGEPVTSVTPALPGDVCLIGTTRAIDW